MRSPSGLADDITEAELRVALETGRLREGDHVDFKRDMPGGDRGNTAIAVDLASFALDGGSILVGIDEGPPPSLSPITLRGQRERVEQIARRRLTRRCTCRFEASPPTRSLVMGT